MLSAPNSADFIRLDSVLACSIQGIDGVGEVDAQ